MWLYRLLKVFFGRANWWGQVEWFMALNCSLPEEKKEGKEGR